LAKNSVHCVVQIARLKNPTQDRELLVQGIRIGPLDFQADRRRPREVHDKGGSGLRDVVEHLPVLVVVVQLVSPDFNGAPRPLFGRGIDKGNRQETRR
jgi:hypothetical protein